ncbi:helix-turn-helix transcriptional regulator [Streptomyces sp. ODS28]|uniref:helix-turn-helix domain-containing protein n=1 Tax=Streptomyces sp. ODS28 TaxID=3136688 RepID=UPI0031E8F27C
MPKELDPTASVAALLGCKVRRLREAAGLTQGELGRKAYTSHARIAQVELATVPPGKDLTQRLEAALGVTDVLMELWRLISRSPYMEWAQRFMVLQQEALSIQEFGQVIPGLVQTEPYARHLMAAGRVFADGALDEVVAARMDRQEVLSREQPPWFSVIVDESVLYKVVGSAEVMGEQLVRLLDLGERPRCEVQVLTFDCTELAVLSGGGSASRTPKVFTPGRCSRNLTE